MRGEAEMTDLYYERSGARRPDNDTPTATLPELLAGIASRRAGEMASEQGGATWGESMRQSMRLQETQRRLAMVHMLFLQKFAVMGPLTGAAAAAGAAGPEGGSPFERSLSVGQLYTQRAGQAPGAGAPGTAGNPLYVTPSDPALFQGELIE